MSFSRQTEVTDKCESSLNSSSSFKMARSPRALSSSPHRLALDANPSLGINKVI